MSGHLLREHAPITDAGWKLIDEEARERLRRGLPRAGSSTSPARTAGSTRRPTSDASSARRQRAEGVEANRRVLPLIELRSRFTVSREELRAGDRGAEDVDFESLDAAAQRIVDAENTAVFHAWPKAGIEGITRARRTNRSCAGRL